MSIAYVKVKKREDFPEHQEMFNFFESYMGYLPHSYLLMAENPILLNAFSEIGRAHV